VPIGGDGAHSQLGGPFTAENLPQIGVVIRDAPAGAVFRQEIMSE